MTMARSWIRALFLCQERPRHGIATVSIKRSRPETGVTKFAPTGGCLGLPGVVGAYLQGKDVRIDVFRVMPLSFYHRDPEVFGVLSVWSQLNV